MRCHRRRDAYQRTCVEQGQRQVPRSHHTSHITHHTSHITHHTSHITHHTSHITHHTSHITYHTSHITHHTSHITHHTSHTTHHTSHITQHTSHITRHTSHTTQHTSHITRHTSHVTPETGASRCPGFRISRIVLLQRRVSRCVHRKPNHFPLHPHSTYPPPLLIPLHPALLLVQTIKLYDIRVKSTSQGSGAVPSISSGSAMVIPSSPPPPPLHHRHAPADHQTRRVCHAAPLAC